MQKRNIHNVMRDFLDEIPGYERNDELISILENLRLETGLAHILSNLQLCYKALVNAKIFPADELDLLNLWLEDIDKTYIF